MLLGIAKEFIRLERSWFHDGHTFSAWRTPDLENRIHVFAMFWFCYWFLPNDLWKSGNQSRQGSTLDFSRVSGPSCATW